VQDKDQEARRAKHLREVERLRIIEQVRVHPSHIPNPIGGLNGVS
jgi:hypothetical protein